MSKGKELSVAEKKVIISMYERGVGPKKISQLTSFKLRTIENVIKKFKDTGSVANKPREGRPRKTTPREDRKIVKIVERNRFSKVADVITTLEGSLSLKISDKTVRRRLHEANLGGRRPVRKPLLGKKNVTKRLKWARKHAAWTTSQWDKVLWSDESKFCFFGDGGPNHVWRRPSERLKDNCVKKTVKHGGGKVMLFVTPANTF